MNPDSPLTLFFRNHWILRLLLASLLALFAPACGGGGGGGSDYSADGGGIGGSGRTVTSVAIGTVSGHGSIIVNGVTFDTSESRIIVEGTHAGTGDQAARSLVPVGREVVVQADDTDLGTGTALQVETFHRVLGPLQDIQIIDERHGILFVMGQAVYIYPDTRWDGVTMGGLAFDMVLEVSGPVDDAGIVHAGYIGLAAPRVEPATPVAVKGRIRDLDTQQKMFRINDLIIDFGDAQAPPEALLENRMVSVRGHLLQETLVAGTVDLFEIESFDALPDLSLEGFIVPSDGAYQWAMGPYQLQFDQHTRYDGLDPEDVAPGVRLLVRGSLQNQVLLVESVSPTARVSLESNVAYVDPSNGELVLEGMHPLVVRVNAQTRFVAQARELSDIQVGDHVRLHAYPLDGNQSVSAVRILVLPGRGNRNKFHMEGPVTRIFATQFEILGVPIDTQASAGNRFHDVDENQVGAADFLNALSVDDSVRVSGRLVGNRVDYEKMGIIRKGNQ
jgi:hypothetical protein